MQAARGLRDIVFFNIAAIASVRWLAPAAHAGAPALSLWLIAALLFFVPSGLVVAHLSSKFPEEGGLYVWTRHAFGERHAFLCAWFYFLSNLFYFPTLVMFAVTIGSYLFSDHAQQLSETRSYALPATLLLLWALFIANYFGVRAAKWIQSFGVAAVIATIVLLAVLVMPLPATHSAGWQLTPALNGDTLNFWSQIAFAFVGLELAPILSGDMEEPARNLPLAALISGLVCAALYLAGTGAILAVLAPEAISPVTGIAQAAVVVAMAWHAPLISTAIIVAVVVATASQLSTWIEGNTRLPYVLSLDRFLPTAFTRLHPRWQTPYVALWVQAAVATAFLLMSYFGETTRAAYQIMVDTVVIATFVPFLYIFGAALRLGRPVAAIPGLAITVLAIAFSLVPPPGVASTIIFEAKVAGGFAIFALAGFWLCNRSPAGDNQR